MNEARTLAAMAAFAAQETALAMLFAFSAICAMAAAWVFILSTANSLWLASTNRLRPTAPIASPRISVLVPARNEAQRIEKCLASLLAQDYADYEIIVYDDDSSDGTGPILDRLAARQAESRQAAARLAAASSPSDTGIPGARSEPSLAIIRGHGLPEGWYGKAWAMHTLAKAASGEYLLFTDADTIHAPGSLARLSALAVRCGADLVSGYVQHEIPNFGQAAVVPAIYLLTMAIMPLALIRATRIPAFSHAIGQCMFFKAESYWRIGGYEAVRGLISEDVRIARLAKRSGAVLAFADLKHQISCSMYEDYRSAVDGIAKNVFDYMNKSRLLLALATIAVPLVCYIPLLASAWLPPALTATIAPFPGRGPISAQNLFRITSALFFAAWIPVTIERRLPWYQPLISPIVLASTLSAGWRARSRFRRGESLVWKGRKVS
ncbi:MAG TPA: glycosyltransferase [Rectinemataceae bacterium]